MFLFLRCIFEDTISAIYLKRKKPKSFWSLNWCFIKNGIITFNKSLCLVTWYLIVLSLLLKYQLPIPPKYFWISSIRSLYFSCCTIVKTNDILKYRFEFFVLLVNTAEKEPSAWTKPAIYSPLIFLFKKFFVMIYIY